jgi:hypothetical protein
MVTSTPLTPSPDGARADDGRDAESPLDRSRTKANRAQQALADASGRVDDIDERLERIGARTIADEKALTAALDTVKRLKKALKDGEKERQKLVLSRKRAIAEVEKAEEKARKAEAKYDREVLADLIERQKENDRAASTPYVAVPGGPAAEAQPPSDGQAGVASGSREASTEPSIEASVEPEDLGTATARSTAARATAESAGASAQPAPKPPTPRRSTRPRTPRTTTARTAQSSSAESSPEASPSQA